jgi:hypothetical protein
MTYAGSSRCKKKSEKVERYRPTCHYRVTGGEEAGCVHNLGCIQLGARPFWIQAENHGNVFVQSVGRDTTVQPFCGPLRARCTNLYLYATLNRNYTRRAPRFDTKQAPAEIIPAPTG